MVDWPATDLMAFLAPLLAAGYVVLGPVARRLDGGVQRLMRPAWARAMSLAAVLPLVLVAAFAYFQGGMGSDLSDQPGLTPVVLPEPEPSSQQAYTDRGKFVPLFIRPPQPIYAEAIRKAQIMEVGPLAGSIIRTAPAEPAYNCHGWIFVGEQCWVRNDQVESILSHNGYNEVTAPKANDLVIYRDSGGAIIHTGLVRIASDGLLLVESKWGLLGRYVHPPADQPYSQTWTYYRTNRGSHQLRQAAADVGRRVR